MSGGMAWALTTVLLGTPAGTRAGGEPSGDKHEYEMTTYQLVLFKTGPNQQTPGDAESGRAQKEHLDRLAALVEEGKALVAGPVEDGGALRGVVVLNVATPDLARQLMADDPWLRSGHLVAEIHPWLAAKGILRKPPVFLDTTPCRLGILERPADAPQLSEERLEEIQAGHMANIDRMAESGDLVIAGPLTDGGPLRGVFVFRTGSADRIKEMVGRDPAVQARRLEMDLYTWHVSKGVLPPP